MARIVQVQIPVDVVSERLDGEAVLLQLSSGEYYGLNASGALIWQLLKEGASVSQIQSALHARYRMDPAVLDADLARILEQLASKGLVTLTRDEG